MNNRTSRRDFLKQSALTGAALTAATLAAREFFMPGLAQAAPEKSKGRPRLGLVT